MDNQNAGVTIAELTPGGIAQIIAWQGFDQQISKIFGDIGQLDYDLSVTAGKYILFRISSDRVQVHHSSQDAITALIGRIDPETCAVCNLSHARAHLRLSGSKSCSSLQSLVALDFNQSAFPVRAFRQTAIHGIHTLILRTAPDAFELWLPSSWARSAQQYIPDATRHFDHV